MTKAQRAAIDKAITKLGGLSAAANFFGLTVGAIAYWRRVGVPAKHVAVLAAQGRVAKRALRPDLYG